MRIPKVIAVVFGAVLAFSSALRAQTQKGTRRRLTQGIYLEFGIRRR